VVLKVLTFEHVDGEGHNVTLIEQRSSNNRTETGSKVGTSSGIRVSSLDR
jgi:plastocyanin